jgi:hypothetical protein
MTYSDEVTKILELIEQEVVTGLKHGHFKIEIEAEMIKAQKCRVIVDAGKKHRFVVSPDGIPV